MISRIDIGWTRSHAISMSFNQSDGGLIFRVYWRYQTKFWSDVNWLPSKAQIETGLKITLPSNQWSAEYKTNDERGSRQIQIPIPCGGSKVAKQNMIGIYWKCLQFSSSMVEGVVRLCWFLLVPVLLELKWFSMLRTSSWIFLNSTRPKISISSRACQPKTYVAFIVAHAKHIEHVA